jgi:hypothetical protein
MSPVRRTPEFALFALSLFLAAPSLAQSGGGFELRPGAIVAGGGVSARGPLRLEGAIGQVPAGESSGGSLRVNGGIWPAIGATRPAAPPAGDLRQRPGAH